MCKRYLSVSDAKIPGRGVRGLECDRAGGLASRDSKTSFVVAAGSAMESLDLSPQPNIRRRSRPFAR